MPQTTASVKFASSLSTLPDTAAATEQVVNTLARVLPGAADLAVAFITPQHALGMERLGAALAGALKARVVLGVTAQGVIGVGREVEDQPAISVLAATLPGAVLQPFSHEEIEWPAVIESPEVLRRTIGVQGGPTRGVVLMADPFSTPMAKLLPAIGACLPGVPLVGGMASGARQPGGNRLLVNGRVYRDGAVGVAIGGDIRIDCTVSQGCRPIGRPLVITKSQRHIILELGGRKALDVLREAAESLSDEDKNLARTNGLFVGRVINEYKDRFGRGDFLIRNLAGIDEKLGYIAVADPQIRAGQTVQFHVRDQKTATEDFQLLLQAQKLHGSAAGGLLFSCNGRGTQLFDHPDADATLIRDALGDAPLAGFFAAGEFGPIGAENFVHGHTASLIIFRPGERDEPDMPLAGQG